MLSILDIYNEVCTKPHTPPFIAISRHKDVLTALKYLASAHGTTPDKLAFTPALEAGYRQQLRTYLKEHQKGYAVIRNTLQYLAQLWRAFHTLDQTPPVPPQSPAIPGASAARKHVRGQSPYRHYSWLCKHPYDLPPKQWPADIADRWDAYLQTRTHDVRGKSLRAYSKRFALYVSYQLMCSSYRMATLPDEALAKLDTRDYQHDLKEMLAPLSVSSWDELFEPSRLNSYITWSSWRCWPWHDEARKAKRPHRPSTQGWQAAVTLEQLAKRTGHPKHAELNRLLNKLPRPAPMHDKRDSRHRFELAELETVALALMDEARRMQIDPRAKGRGARQAVRFQLGLILQLLWRNPMRARNWCEAILGINLKHEDGQWRWRFEGAEMKIGMRGPRVNVFDPEVPVEVAPHLDEFLSRYRLHLPNAARDRHVFLSMWGTPLTESGLSNLLKWHVNRFTDRYIYTHLLRSIFSTHHLSHGMDINSVAYAMNNTPASVLKAYNELMADTHRPIIADANRQALAHGHKPLTPPVIPLPPKPPKPAKADPDQLRLL